MFTNTEEKLRDSVISGYYYYSIINIIIITILLGQSSTLYNSLYISVCHRRRIELEDKAKVVSSVWGTESLLRKLVCLGLFGTKGLVQPFISNRLAEFNRLSQIDRLSSTVCGAK